MGNERSIGELVTAAKGGDQEALTILYEKTSSKAYYLSFQLVKDEDTAQDILQDAYIKAFGSLETLAEPEKFQGWLDTIVVNKSKDFLKKKKPVFFSQMTVGDDGGSGENEKEIDFEDESMAFSPEKTMDYKETKRLIQAMIDELPEEQRMAIILRYLEDMPVADIARVMECSEGTVKSRLNYGRKSIKAKVLELEKKGTKLYVVPFAGFLFWMFKTETTAYAAPNVLSGVLSALGAATETAAGAASAGASATSAAAQTGATASASSGTIASGSAAAFGGGSATGAVSTAGGIAAGTAAKAAGAAAVKTVSAKAAAVIVAACVGVGAAGGVAAHTVSERLNSNAEEGISEEPSEGGQEILSESADGTDVEQAALEAEMLAAWDNEDEQRIWRGIGTVLGDTTPYIFEFREAEAGGTATDNDRSTLALKALEDLRYTSWVQGTIGGTDFALRDYTGSILPEEAIDNYQMATVAFDTDAAEEAIADCYGYSLSDCYVVYEEYSNRNMEWSDSLSVYLDDLEEYFSRADNPPEEISSLAPDEYMVLNSNIETVSTEGGYYLIDFPEGDISNGYPTFYITGASVEGGMLRVEGLKSMISYDPNSMEYAGYDPWETDSYGNQMYKGEDIPVAMYLSYHPENSFSKFRLEGLVYDGEISGTVPDSVTEDVTDDASEDPSESSLSASSKAAEWTAEDEELWKKVFSAMGLCNYSEGGRRWIFNDESISHRDEIFTWFSSAMADSYEWGTNEEDNTYAAMDIALMESFASDCFGEEGYRAEIERQVAEYKTIKEGNPFFPPSRNQEISGDTYIETGNPESVYQDDMEKAEEALERIEIDSVTKDGDKYTVSGTVNSIDYLSSDNSEVKEDFTAVFNYNPSGTLTKFRLEYMEKD